MIIRSELTHVKDNWVSQIQWKEKEQNLTVDLNIWYQYCHPAVGNSSRGPGVGAQLWFWLGWGERPK